jgi:hypothetical protein
MLAPCRLRYVMFQSVPSATRLSRSLKVSRATLPRAPLGLTRRFARWTVPVMLDIQQPALTIGR